MLYSLLIIFQNDAEILSSSLTLAKRSPLHPGRIVVFADRGQPGTLTPGNQNQGWLCPFYGSCGT